jgi:protein SCO1/2
MPSARRLSLALVGAMLAAACGPAPPESDGKSYSLRGTVVAVDAANRKITIDHEEIPGFMPAMTMPFVFGGP